MSDPDPPRREPPRHHDSVPRAPSPGGPSDGGFLSAGQAMVLGMAAAGAPLGSVLHAVVELIEMEIADARCSVLLTDPDGMLRPAAAPTLPPGYVQLLSDGVPIADDAGSCGTAACIGRPVIDADITTSARWQRYAGAALRYGLRACWSVPILGEGEQALGAFAVYYEEPREPSGFDLQQMSGFAQLVAVAVRQDRTSRALERSKRTDPITGLPGRDQLFPAVQRAVVAAQEEGEDGAAAVVLVEMRRLRECNEAFGYGGGDELIVQAAGRLSAVVGESGQVFRTGGSGFAAVLHTARDLRGRDLGDELLRLLKAPMTIASTSFTPSPRIGLAELSPAMADAGALLESAQAAIHEARQGTGPTLVRARTAGGGRAAKGLHLENDLRRALMAWELVPHYQPQYSLDTGRIVGVEALVRWPHPGRGLLQPAEFLDVVDSGNLHGELLGVVLQQACHAASGWHRDHPDLPVVLSVNLAPANLLDPGMVSVVEEALASSGLPGGLLCLEVTEQAAVMDLDTAVASMEHLKSLGVQTALDDFGTGYSSLAYARQLPIDLLKVDRQFVQRIVDEHQDRAVVAAVVGLGNGLGIQVLAEGVETEEQRRTVRELGCQLGQGFLWSPAVPAESVGALLDATTDAPPAARPQVEAAREGGWDDRTDTFLAHVVHEARTPLTVLQLQAELLGLGLPDAEQVAAAVATIGRQVTALEEILSATADVRDLARGSLPLHLTRVDLGALASEVAADLSGAVPAAVRVECPEDVVAYADRSRVRQILANLLNNAGKHAPASSTIDVVAARRGPVASVIVRDRGPGVPADKTELIFQQFGRADHSKPGLGLGLYIARQLARSHGGDLTYRPAAPTGAIFELTLPVAAEG